MTYQFIDAYGSVLTAASNAVGGAQQPIVQVSSISGTVQVSVLGAVPVTMSGSNTTSVVGTVAVTQGGSFTASIVGGYAEDTAHVGGSAGIFVMGVRNDTMASTISADGEYGQFSLGPSGEQVAVNAPYTRWVQGNASVFTGSSVQAIAPQGAGVFTYVTGVQIANPSANNVFVRFTGGLGSTLGWTIAPANGGSNIAFPNGLKTGANAGFSASVSGVSSVYVSAQGFIANS